ncbi:MAG: hypothetical protein EKK40_02850 [Bradyrhizobiaceae bacterium]|nr:MAG: hypothetical protein EKK40_02850 [Bradyrhizobiaceae bacterium]
MFARRTRVPTFIIAAPNYTAMSSGIRCLHLLCHRLNLAGFSAAVTARRRNKHLETPRIRSSWIRNAPALLKNSIVIYPEIVQGNPLHAPNVVRYLLNRPGFLGPAGLDDYGEGDYFVHFAEEFRPPALQSRLLRLPLVDTGVFKPPQAEDERQGFLLYNARHTPDRSSFPGWIDNITVISPDHPRTPDQLAALYGRSRALITAERTAAVNEALHCHCPVIMLPNDRFDHVPFMSAFGGVGRIAGFDQAALEWATETAREFPARYAQDFAGADNAVVEFATDALRYFDLKSASNAA